MRRWRLESSCTKYRIVEDLRIDSMFSRLKTSERILAIKTRDLVSNVLVISATTEYPVAGRRRSSSGIQFPRHIDDLIILFLRS